MKTASKRIQDQLENLFGEPFSLEKLAKEGSSKKIYTVVKENKKEAMLLMRMEETPPFRGGLEEWERAQKALSPYLRVPRILHKLKGEKALLIENCGKENLTKHLENKETGDIKNYLTQAVKLLLSLQKAPTRGLKLTLTHEELERDFKLFRDEHIARREESLKDLWKEKTFWEEAKLLSTFLAKEKQVFVHRDFHSGNFIKNKEELVLIDFQDASRGPILYDFVSLFLDPYIKLEPKLRNKLMKESFLFFEQGLREKEKKDLKETLKAQIIQRAYKILGSYSFLGEVKKKKKFLSYIKPVLSFLNESNLYDSRWPYLSKTLKEGLIHAEG